MAERRMFAKTIIDSDLFLEMPLTTQALYFHLSMRADDDGFVNNPKKIARMIGTSEDELKLLIAKKFIIPFETGVCVIRHWRIHNYIQKDRYKETLYSDEKSFLIQDESGAYSEMDTTCIQPVSKMDTQVSIGKDRLGKVSIGKDRLEQEEYTPSVVYSSCSGALLQSAQDTETQKTSPSRFIPPTVDQVKAYCEERGNGIDPQRFVDFYSSKGWMVGKNKMKDWKAAIRGWESRNTQAPAPQQPQQLSGGDRLLEMIRRGDFDE